MLGKNSSPVRTWRPCGNGVEHGLRDEAERALRAHQQAAEDLHRLVGVEERAQAVAGGVLDLELRPDPLGELLVGADLVADGRQPLGQLGLLAREALGGVGRGGVDPGAARRSRTPASAAWSRSRGARRSACRRRCWRSRRRPWRGRWTRGRGPRGARACASARFTRPSTVPGPTRTALAAVHAPGCPRSCAARPRGCPRPGPGR